MGLAISAEVATSGVVDGEELGVAVVALAGVAGEVERLGSAAEGCGLVEADGEADGEEDERGEVEECGGGQQRGREVEARGRGVWRAHRDGDVRGLRGAGAAEGLSQWRMAWRIWAGLAEMAGRRTSAKRAVVQRAWWKAGPARREARAAIHAAAKTSGICQRALSA